MDIGIIGIPALEEDGTLRNFDPREVKVVQVRVAA